MVTPLPPKRVEEGEMLLRDVQELLRVPPIGVIPESDDVPGLQPGHPAIHLKDSDVATAYSGDVVARFRCRRPSAALSSPTRSPLAS